MNIFISNTENNRRWETGCQIKGAFLALLFLLTTRPVNVVAEEIPPYVMVKDGVSAVVLPDSLKRFIAIKFPDLRLPTKADLTGPWAAFDKKEAVPYACWGRFDNRGGIDVALILLGQGVWRVLAFHPLENGQYAVLPLEDYAGSIEGFSKSHAAQEFYIHTVRESEQIVIDGRKVPETEHAHDAVAFFSLKDPHTGILYQWMPPGHPKREEYQYGLYIASVFGALSD